MPTLPQLIEEGKAEFLSLLGEYAEAHYFEREGCRNQEHGHAAYKKKMGEKLDAFLTSFALKIAESAKEETVITWGSANPQTEQAEKWEGFLQGKKDIKP